MSRPPKFGPVPGIHPLPPADEARAKLIDELAVEGARRECAERELAEWKARTKQAEALLRRAWDALIEAGLDNGYTALANDLTSWLEES